MALTNCNECGKQVSTEASTCPHCGYSFRLQRVHGITRALSPRLASVPFFAILLCFALPFLEVSCRGRTVRSFSGYDTAFGATIDDSTSFGPSAKKQTEPVSELILVLVGTLLTGFLCLRGIGGTPIFAVGVLFLLLHTRSAISTEILQQSHGLLAVDSGSGYYCTLFLLITGLVLSILSISIPNIADSNRT